MIMSFGEGAIFAALILLVMAVIKTGDRIVAAIRYRHDDPELQQLMDAYEKAGSEVAKAIRARSQ